MRIGVCGGTFDPVHLGHLVLAEQSREQAALDQVWFIPSARPPHKQDRSVSPFHHRLEMLQLAIAGHAAFRVNDLEAERPGVSYTADTLNELRSRNPGDDFDFIIGSDCLPDLVHWYQPARILELAELIVVKREGWPQPPLSRAPRRGVLYRDSPSLSAADLMRTGVIRHWSFANDE
jgi:nicotinate-nucleotide adenylyltransferase